MLLLLDAMGAEGTLQISTDSMMDEVLQHRRSRSIDIVLRKDEEACMVLLSRKLFLYYYTRFCLICNAAVLND